MPDFNVEFTPRAARDLRKLDPPRRAQLLRAASALTQNPYPTSGGRIKLLVGVMARHFRLRLGDYRIVYRVEADHVIVVRIAHRREAYR